MTDLSIPEAPDTLGGLRALLAGAPNPDRDARAAARDRQAQLTKPPGSLGRLEDLAVWYAGWRGTPRPRLERPQVAVFAGNHAVAARGVSAYPAEVTAQMVANFRAGGAAINQLARVAGAGLTVVPLELDRPVGDITQGPAMIGAEAIAAIAAGWNAVDPAADLLVVGEMGIGNTTAAAALALALYGGAAEDWVGPGTGVDAAGLARKAEAVRAAVARNGSLEAGVPAIDLLRRLGGREIAAMAGAIARARMGRVPVILDGFIATAAAAVLHEAVPGALDHVVAGHVSAEPAHGRLLANLGMEPVLDLGMRLGEGSGAAVAIAVLRAAVECHSGMATFAEAGVSGG